MEASIQQQLPTRYRKLKMIFNWPLKPSNQIGTNVWSCVYWTYNNAAKVKIT